MAKEKVVIGLSGGVDSATAAYLLKKDGYEVIGVTIINWDGGAEACSDAAGIAEKLGISHYILDFRKEFKNKVEDMFVREYLMGRTPNPCVMCNRDVKWGAVMAAKNDIGADYVATGHYANILKYPKTGRLAVVVSDDEKKDQTYVLSMLTQEQLKCTLFPMGKYTKEETRKIAAEAGISVAEKPDSQEICFIPDKDYVSFIENYTGEKAKEGNYVDFEGNVIGRHKGIINYTIGQRKGLGVSFGKHMFVNAIDAEKNEVVLGSNESLFKNTVYAGNINFMALDKIQEPIRAKAKIRYAHKRAECTIYPCENGMAKFVSDEPQRAVTPGQAIAAYDGDYCLLGGIIEKGERV